MLFFIVSCSSVKQGEKESWKGIIKKEIDSKSKSLNNERIYLTFSLNDYLISFFEENKNLMEVQTKFENKLNFDEINLIFEKKQLDYLLSQINTMDLQEGDLAIPENVKFEEEINNSQDDISIIDRMTKTSLNLSYPVITMNNEFGLIAYSFGIQNEMQGGIAVYRREKSNWKFYTELNSWIE